VPGVRKILVAGDINVDLVCRGYRTFPAPGKEVLVDDFVMTLGGSSAICAMGLARLGNPVAFIGKVGADPWGDFCFETMRAAGIDVSGLARDPALRTGVTISITSAIDRALITFAGSIAALCADDVDAWALDDAGHLHLSSFFLQKDLRPACRRLFALARSNGLSTSLDPGYDPAECWGPDLLETLEAVDLLLPNEVELAAISGTTDLADGLRRMSKGRTSVVAKLGQRGSATLAEDAVLEVPAFAVDAIDTTGAGDSFDAGFLHAWLRGQPLRECLRWGSACGALSVRCLGGTASQPDAAEVRALLAS
jgi:sugar/nucleoside kinase (ribokinase family)